MKSLSALIVVACLLAGVCRASEKEEGQILQGFLGLCKKYDGSEMPISVIVVGRKAYYYIPLEVVNYVNSNRIMLKRGLSTYLVKKEGLSNSKILVEVVKNVFKNKAEMLTE